MGFFFNNEAGLEDAVILFCKCSANTTTPGFDSLAPSDPSDVVLVERAPSRVDPVAPAEPVPADPLGFQDATEEEVAIAFHYETLADLEMIEELEMLELLAALDDGGPRG